LKLEGKFLNRVFDCLMEYLVLEIQRDLVSDDKLCKKKNQKFCYWKADGSSDQQENKSCNLL